MCIKFHNLRDEEVDVISIVCFIHTSMFSLYLLYRVSTTFIPLLYCEAQARVRQGLARDGPQGERPQSLNPCLELTLKLVATFHHHHPYVYFSLTNGLAVVR